MLGPELPLPPHYDPARAGEVWRVPYAERARDAVDWARRHGLRPAAGDEPRVCLMLVDCQNTFCLPEFELYVGGRSGAGAVEDTVRIAEFVYRNLGAVTRIVATVDTHSAAQIFHPLFWLDPEGSHPEPGTVIGPEDVAEGRWRPDPEVAASLGLGPDAVARHARYYVDRLAAGGRFPLMIWPYHAMLGGVGHSLVATIEEALFVHSVARGARLEVEAKGGHPLTEHYSALGPEVREDADGRPLVGFAEALVDRLLAHDAIAIAGQAKSHCVNWTVRDLIDAAQARDPALIGRIHLLEVLQRLTDQGNTVVVIEHNLDVIKSADWIVDLGPEGGAAGGALVASGTSEQVAAEPGSYTGEFLASLLEVPRQGRTRGRRKAAAAA